MTNKNSNYDFSSQTPAEKTKTRALMLAMVVSSSLLGNIGMTGVNLALPLMEKNLKLSAVLMGWVPLSLLMSMAATAAPSAKIADIFGRRLIMTIGFIMAIGGSIICALSPSPAPLITGRVITGLGLAACFTNSTAMMVTLFPKERRGAVLGYTISSVYVGLSIGPVISGYLVETFGWSSIFWLNGLGLIPALIILRLVKVEQRPAQGQKFDFLGSFLWTTAIMTLFLGLSNLGWSGYGWGITLAGLTTAFIFVKYALKAPDPVLDIRLFSGNRRFAFSSLAALISYSASAGTIFLLSLYLQYIKDLSPKEAGLILMVQPVCQALLTPLTGRLSDRLEAGLLASVGMSLLFCAVMFLAFRLKADTSINVLIGVLVLLGIGFSLFSAPNSNAIIGAVPLSKTGQATGVITVTRLCGQMFSFSITTLIFSLVIGPGLITPDRYPAFLKAAVICFKIFTPICLTAILASLARGKKNTDMETNS